MAGVPVVFSEVLNVSVISEVWSPRDPTAITTNGWCGVGWLSRGAHAVASATTGVAKAWHFGIPGRV